MAMDGGGSSLIAYVAQASGSSEPALRLLISILSGYPIAFLYRHFFYGKSATQQHLFFTLAGIALCYFNYGIDVVHSIGCVLVLYVLLLVEGGTLLSVIFGFVYFMEITWKCISALLGLQGYLLFGYYLTETDNYDIKWTMPQCVLTLRLIGVVFDMYDGRSKKQEELSVDQKKVAFTNAPSLLELFGYVYFFGGFLVGPQFSMKRYQEFVHGTMGLPKDSKPNSVTAGLTRGSAGLAYLVLFLIGNSYFPFSYIYSETFQNHSIFMKFITMGLWGKICILKYIISWILAEGSCIITGITYNGKDESGEERWNACTNVLIMRYEGATRFHHIVESFNILTNKWSANYVFKRLRFLGNKEASHIITLMFLALWHGLHIAYYFVFFLEYLYLKFDSDVRYLVSKNPTLSSLTQLPPIKILGNIFLTVYLHVMLSYALVPFFAINWDKSIQIYSELYFLGHVLYLSWPIGYAAWNMFNKKKGGHRKAPNENGVKMD